MLFDSREQCAQERLAWKEQGLKVGFTSGVFDLLHPGHLEYLIQAKTHCDRLIVAVNSDASVRSYKGNQRPIQAEKHRVKLVDGLKPVDAAFIFTESKNHENIQTLKPDLYIKAGDYDKSSLSSAPLVEAYGGEVLLIPIESETSTSGIIDNVIGKNCSHLKSDGLKPRKVIFLDRDGVINEEVEYLHEPEKFKLTKNCLAGLEKLSQAGYALVVITNQAGIGLGYFSHEDFYKINKVMFSHLKDTSVMLDKIYYCPHAFSEKCQCRKPNTGMLERAFEELSLIKEGSYVIGDRETDVEAGQNFGIDAVLISNKPKETKAQMIASDLLEAAEYILSK